VRAKDKLLWFAFGVTYEIRKDFKLDMEKYQTNSTVGFWKPKQ
jgi:hypothetical protein